jgi:U3 small nucleolar ribonucleoprotein protein LCP5
MAAAATLPTLLDSLTLSLTSAFDATPKLEGIEPPKDGVSLLDVKNELLLSYLQNLVFLILLKIRNAKKSSNADADDDNEPKLEDIAVQKLVELRLYLEKGVRPLEEKLRFQLEKILRVAENADRNDEAAKSAINGFSKKGKAGNEDPDASDDSDDEDDDEDKLENEDAKSAAPTFKFARSAQPVGMAAAATASDKTGVYRPPRIAPTVMPTTERREARNDRASRPMKSATMDEYVATELSAAPLAEPSIGTTIVSGGRKVKTTAERAEEDRRREYEETNFVRLPKESKKDRTKRLKSEGGSRKMQFGGEDWRDLGEGVDRIERMTRRRDGGGTGTKALLDRSRKRGRETTDADRGSGLNSGTREIGDRYAKKVKVMEGGRRDRGKR